MRRIFCGVAIILASVAVSASRVYGQTIVPRGCDESTEAQIRAQIAQLPNYVSFDGLECRVAEPDTDTSLETYMFILDAVAALVIFERVEDEVIVDATLFVDFECTMTNLHPGDCSVAMLNKAFVEGGTGSRNSDWERVQEDDPQDTAIIFMEKGSQAMEKR